MKSILKFCSFCLLSGAISFAQVASHNTSGENERVEVFGGYAYQHLSSNGVSTGTNGWDASVTIYPVKYLGLTADIDGQYQSKSAYGLTESGHVVSYLFGPTVPLQTDGMKRYRTKAFVHALFGGSSASASVSGYGSTGSSNQFAMAFGGGLDIAINRHWSVRPVQADYIDHRRSVYGTTISVDCFRYAPGLVLKF